MLHAAGFTYEGKVERGIQVFRHKHFVWGWLAIFLYVGNEVTIGSILINYLGSPEVVGLPAEQADKYLSFYWGGLMIGRLMGSVGLRGSLAVVFTGYVYLIFFGFYGAWLGHEADEAPPSARAGH